MDAGLGTGFGFEMRAERRADPRIGGAGSVIVSADQHSLVGRERNTNTMIRHEYNDSHMFMIVLSDKRCLDTSQMNKVDN